MEFVSAAANVSFKNKGNTVTFDAVPIPSAWRENQAYKVVCKVIKAGSAKMQPYLPMTSLIGPL